MQDHLLVLTVVGLALVALVVLGWLRDNSRRGEAARWEALRKNGQKGVSLNLETVSDARLVGLSEAPGFEHGYVVIFSSPAARSEPRFGLLVSRPKSWLRPHSYLVQDLDLTAEQVRDLSTRVGFVALAGDDVVQVEYRFFPFDIVPDD